LLLNLVLGKWGLNPVIEACNLAFLNDVLVKVSCQGNNERTVLFGSIPSQIVSILTMVKIPALQVEVQERMDAQVFAILSLPDLLTSIIAIHDGHI
jgi:hypothetical protein